MRKRNEREKDREREKEKRKIEREDIYKCLNVIEHEF